MPIPGTIKTHRLTENLAAATSNELTQLAEPSSRIDIQGGRYPDFLEAQIL